MITRARLANLLARVRGSAVVRSLGASSASLVATTAIQIATVPLFLTSVGPIAYGQWLVITAIPSYLSLADLGFSGAAATRATGWLVQNRKDQANRTLATAFWTVGGVLAVAMTIGLPGVWLLLSESAFSALQGDARLILTIQLLWVTTLMMAGFLEAAMRAAGHFAVGISQFTALRLVEFAALSAALLTSGDLLLAAATLLGCRIVGCLAIAFAVKRRLAWLSIAPALTSRGEARHLLGPSITYAGFSVGYAILNQGFTILIGTLLGYREVVQITALRTAVGSMQQLVGVVSNGALPSLTEAYARGDERQSRSLLRWAQRTSLLLSGAAGAFLVVLGGFVLDLWTNGQATPDRALIAAMVATLFLGAFWQVRAMALRARNLHQRAGIAFLASAVLSVLCLAALLPAIGLYAVPLALTIIDMVMIPLVRKELRRTAPQIDRMPV